MKTQTVANPELSTVPGLDKCPRCGQLFPWIIAALLAGPNSPKYLSAMDAMSQCDTCKQQITEILLENEAVFISHIKHIRQKDARQPRGYCPYNFDACTKHCDQWRRGRCKQSGIRPSENQPLYGGTN